MKAINWKTAFWGKLRWNLIWGSWRKRSEIKLQKKARRKHDGLGSQLEDLEIRVMLSGTTAVNDQAILKNVGVPVTLDVLSNDVSGNGQLNIVGASIVGGSGTVVIVDGQSGASGAAGRDQVKVTLASNFTGNAQIQYTIEDQSGNQSTAVATMQISAATGSAFNGSGSGSGALTVSGGTGGGHVVTPTDHYLPTESGNYSYSQGVLGAAYSAQGATGTQDITKTVTTTSYGVANWSYSELVTWVYDIYSNDGNGNTKHLFGGYTYTFSSVSVNGVITTTLAYVAGDHYDNNDVTTTATSTFSNHSWGTINTVVTVINIDDVLDSGSVYYHNDSTTGSLGVGSYSRPMPGGSISGSMNGNSFGFNTLTMSKAYTQLVTGGFYVAGIVSMNGNGNKSFGYNGGGTYGDSSMMITASEDGGQSESYNYTGGGGFTSLAGWVLAGAGYTEGDQHSNFSYIGSGSYSREFHGGTMSGTQNANGHNKSSGDFRIDYSLNAGGWYITSGTNGGSGDSLSHFDYEGSGSYVFGQSSSGYSQTLSGSMSEDGHNTTRSNYTTSGTLNVSTMTWSNTGSGSGSGDNHDHLEYNGSGSYFREIHGGTVSGSANEDYNHNTSGSFATTSTLLPTGSWVTAGSGAASGTSHNHTDYSGQGNYSRTEGTANGQITYTGTQKQDGHTTVDQKWETKSFLAVTGLVTTYGSGSGTTDSHNYTYFSGSASYSRVTADGSGTISGKKNEEREDYEEQQAKTQTDSIEEGYGGFGTAISASGGGTTWSLTTGSATASGHGFAKTNWSGSGSYSKTTTNNQGNTVSTYTGNVFTEEKGHANSDYSASSKSTLQLDGTWFKTSGSGKSSGDNHDYSFTKSWGGYSKNTTGANGYESSYSGSYFNSSKAENFSNWDEKNSVIDGEFKQTAGNASGNGTTETISSNSGGGTYSHNAGAYNSHISGSVNEDSYSRDATKYSTTSTWSSADGWTTSGTQSGDGTSRYHSDYSGKGRMNTISSLGSAYNSSSGMTGLMGDVNENGETNNNSKYSSDYIWVEGSSGSVASGSGSGVAPTSSDWKLVSGSASDWGDGKTHVDWDGTGSYNSGGSDNRWGTWSVSGTTTSKGHTNTGNKWEKSSEVQTAASGNEKVWVTTGGSGSDWGDSLKETTHSGSGTWSAWVLNGSITAIFPGNGAYQAGGTVKQKGSTKDTDNWNQKTVLELSSGAGSASAEGDSGGESWKVVSGDLDGTSHMDDRNEFGYSSANYVATGASWMRGSMSAYGYTQVIDDANWHSIWSQSVRLSDPEEDGGLAVYGPGWYLQSGSGRVDETNGSGKTYSGSGSYTVTGTYPQEQGGGTWSFSASATQSGKIEDGDGIFVTTSIQSGSWVATDSGATASGFSEEKWQWDGKGQFTNGAMSGSFGQGAKSLFKDSYSFEYTESTGSNTADRDEEWDSSGYNNYSASGTVYFEGVSGKYNEHADTDWSSSGNVDYDWDTSIPDDYTLGILVEVQSQWVAKSGTATDESNANGGNDFTGSSSYSAFGGGTTVSTRSFDNSFNNHTTEQYKVVPQTAVRVETIPAEGRTLGWTLTSGTHTEGGNGNYDSTDTTTGSYITPIYHISGSFVDKSLTHSDYNWNLTSTFSSGTSAWNTTGSGTINANASGQFAYSGSENYSTNGGSGTRSELQEDNWTSKLNLEQTWVDTAGGGRPDGDGTVGAGGERNTVTANSSSQATGVTPAAPVRQPTASGKSSSIKLNLGALGLLVLR